MHEMISRHKSESLRVPVTPSPRREAFRALPSFFCRFGPASPRRKTALLLGWLALCVSGGCRPTDPASEVELRVREVMIDPASRAPVILLEDRISGKELPIWIGAMEAQAIAMHLEGVKPLRPLTHDLIKNILDGAGVRFERVLIHSLKEGTYYARIFLIVGGDRLEIDSRPSDAIALAVRFERPIFVSRQVLDEASTTALGSPGNESLTVGGLTVQTLSAELAEHFDLQPGAGVLVSAVAPGTSEELQPGDVILEVEGEAVASPNEFAAALRASSGKVDLAVQRHGERIHVTVVAGGHGR